MATFDYVVLGIVAISLMLGMWRGVVSELIALVAWVMAFMAALEFGADAGKTLFSGFADPVIQVLAGCVLIFVGVLVLMSLIRLAVRSMVKALGLSLSDRLLGMFFGLARGVLLLTVGALLAGLTEVPRQPLWQGSAVAQPLERLAMAARTWLPDDIAARVRFAPQAEDAAPLGALLPPQVSGMVQPAMPASPPTMGNPGGR